MTDTKKTDKSPKISVIIPVFNVEKFLPRCLDSVLHQTFSDFEVICVNDGSPDNCDKILEQYAQKDNRIKIISQINQGLSMARNNGFKYALGEYIYFLDSDDFIHPQLLEYAYKLAVGNKADIVEFDFKKIKIDSEFNVGKENLPEFDKIEYTVTDNPLDFWCIKRKPKISFNVWTKLYKKELIDNFRFIANIHYEDYPFNCAVLSKRPKYILTNLQMHYYFYNPQSISNIKANPKQIRDYHTGISYIYDFYKSASKKDLEQIKRRFIPSILKQQLAKCRNADKEVRPLMYEAFAEELCDLDSKNLLNWHGHNIFRYLTYRRLIKAYKK